MPYIEHKNPTRPQRAATAPYNFVPLPRAVYFPEGDLPSLGAFAGGLRRGYIECELRALTPLYTRGPRHRGADGRWDGRDARERPEFYALVQGGRPMIPGRTLRGLIRGLVEIIGFGKMQPVSSEGAFYRTVDDSRIGKLYRNRMGSARQAGFIRIDGAQRWIAPSVEGYYRVGANALPPHISQCLPRNPSPRSVEELARNRGRYAPCRIRPSGNGLPLSGGQIRFGAIQPGEQAQGWREAVLVLTGPAGPKRREFVFLKETEPKGKWIRIPDALWERFHDKDQISQWQEKAFPGRPGSREPDGSLRNGDPVFYLADESMAGEGNPDGLRFFGRAGLFRLPYDLSPAEMIPVVGNSSRELDLAERIFGVAGKDPRRGRVRVESAHLCGDPDGATEPICTLKILGSPSPTCYAHYLVQQSDDRDSLATYLTDDRSKTQLRGHKLYFHHWDEQHGMDAVGTAGNHLQGDTQRTVVECVKAGRTFRFRVSFDNLSDVELGALLSALDLPRECAHKVGMGKPLGLGGVRITPVLYLIENERRYGGEDFADLGVRRAADAEVSAFKESFAAEILAHAHRTGEKITPGRSGLSAIDRLRLLFVLLDYDHRPDSALVAYLPVSGGGRNQPPVASYRDRRVLPLPDSLVKPEVPNAAEGGPRNPGGRPGGGGAFRPRGGHSQGATRGQSDPPRGGGHPDPTPAAAAPDRLPARAPAEVAGRQRDVLLDQIGALRRPNDMGAVPGIIARIEQLALPEHRSECAQALQQRLQRRDLQNVWMQPKREAERKRLARLLKP